jgi:hypothetical protein
MSKTGFIIHKGIQQIFTTGPFQGSTVVNGYSINGVLQGPTVNHNQPFIEGSVEIISANNILWRRKYEDQTQCATDCNAPVLSSVVSNCSTNTFTLVNSNVNTSISPSTIVEVSLNPTGFPVAQRYTQTSNTNGNNTYNIDITSLGIVRGTTIYFRLINLCNNGTIESFPSNIISTICASEPPPPPPPPPPTTVRLNWDFLTAGGYSPGSFQLNVNGIGNISVNSSDSGFIEVPLNSLIEVYVNAPLADTSIDTPIFVSQVFATTSQGGASSNVGTTFAEISFTITEETYVKGIAQVGNDSTPSFV